MINLSEIFLSIQGESSFSGLPCIFIRFAGCNLRCSYCDTTYAYKTSFSLDIGAILSRIKEFEPIKLVEITGGEPLLQAGIYDLIKELHKYDYKILLETNGSISLHDIPNYVIKIIDIKCPSSGEEKKNFLGNLNFLNHADEIKFVLGNESDYRWANDFINENMIGKKQILFSCVYDKLEPEKMVSWIIRDKLDVRFQLQLQKYIWHPDSKGV